MNDYIKREDAVKWLKNLFDDCGNYMPLWHYGEVLPKIIELLEADVAPVRHGRWKHERLPSTSGGSYAVVRCSACEYQYPMAETRYCPNCGAKMDGGESDD